jgi:hypothetical protein
VVVVLAVVVGGGLLNCNRRPLWGEGHEYVNIMAGLRTDLVETTLVREDGNVPVVACTSYMTRVAVSKCACGQKLGGGFLRTRHDGGSFLCVFGYFKFSCSSRRLA